MDATVFTRAAGGPRDNRRSGAREDTPGGDLANRAGGSQEWPARRDRCPATERRGEMRPTGASARRRRRVDALASSNGGCCTCDDRARRSDPIWRCNAAGAPPPMRELYLPCRFLRRLAPGFSPMVRTESVRRSHPCSRLPTTGTRCDSAEARQRGCTASLARSERPSGSRRDPLQAASRIAGDPARIAEPGHAYSCVSRHSI